MAVESTNTIKMVDSEIDFAQIFSALWKKKLLVVLITLFSAIGSVAYSLSLPNIFTSKALLSPSNQSESMASLMGSYSTLAGIAGINLSAESGNKTQEAIARMRSIDFFEDFVYPNIKLEDLMAVKEWRSKDNILIYDKNIFNNKTNKWVREVNLPKKTIPSTQEAFKVFNEAFSVIDNKTTGFVTISVDHQSTFVAKDWTEIVVKNINESMRAIDKLEASKSIEFLNEQAKLTKLTEIKEAISQLLESQIQTLMLASVSDGYVFNTINSPIISEFKSSPNRPLICILGTFLGFIISVLLSLFLHFYHRKSVISSKPE